MGKSSGHPSVPPFPTVRFAVRLAELADLPSASPSPSDQAMSGQQDSSLPQAVDGGKGGVTVRDVIHAKDDVSGFLAAGCFVTNLCVCLRLKTQGI